MRLISAVRDVAAATFLGALGGVVVLHPYSMAVYRLLVPMEHMSTASLPQWVAMSFSPHMAPMMAFYAAIGGAFGLCLKLVLIARARLAEQRAALETRRVAHETLQDTVLTLSHYIRNANASIGGYSQRLASKQLPPETIKQHAEIIHAEAIQIDAVMDALECLQDPEARENVGSTHIRMLDIRKQIQEKLDARRTGTPS